MLTQNFALNLSASLSGSPFSFDELIQESKSLFKREGIPGFISVLLALIDEFAVSQLYPEHGKSCCESPTFRRAGRKGKSIMTTLGKLSFEWSHL